MSTSVSGHPQYVEFIDINMYSTIYTDCLLTRQLDPSFQMKFLD